MHQVLGQNIYRDLLTAYGTHPDRAAIGVELKRVYELSQRFIPDEELAQLETFARRIRGEIFFARRWLLVEGQCEYHLVHGIAEGLGYNLDEHGVSVIDFQNNGNPECFCALGRALGYPWLMIVDGDAAGTSYIQKLSPRGFNVAEIAHRTYQLAEGDIEQQLIADGLQAELKASLLDIGETKAPTYDDAALLKALVASKSAYGAVLGRKCAQDAALAARMPKAFRDAIISLRGLE
ncbi:ATP-dependent endonuclease [Paeniroseomonas aquatica]|uniref:ATP-dependent nuclease n=1 Tax=Paeniroseomonas aquatica TaxID=373043 RepID=UPI003614CE4B